MEITLLNQKITFQVGTVSMDTDGNRANTYTDLYSCFATISGESGSEDLSSGDIRTKIKASFTVRYCQMVSQVKAGTHRIKYGTDYYNIISIDHKGYRNKLVKFTCEKV